MTTHPVLPDQLQADDWAGDMGQTWLASLDRFESMIAPIGAALLARADYQPGERVLDIGCGGGANTLQIAHAVGPDGAVLGIDISPDLTAAAQARAQAARCAQMQVICADAATHTLAEPPFDRLFSRFGTMFFADARVAFANLHRMLRPGGRIDLAVWAAPRDNPWMMNIMSLVRRHADIPPAIPRAPGPFALEDRSYLADVLAAGGFSAPDIAAYEGRQALGGTGATPQQALDFVLASLSVGRIITGLDSGARDRVVQDMTALFAQHHVPGEGVMMDAKAWLVRATA